MEQEKLIYYSVIENRLADLKDLLRDKMAVDGIKPYGQSLLLHAVFKGHYDIAVFLIERGSNVNEKDDKGYTSLHAAAYYHNFQIARLLIDSGALIDMEDNFGNTPLIEAVSTYKNDIRVIGLLLENKADPYHKNNFGMDPYNLAIDSKKTEIVECIHNLKAQGKIG